MKRYLLLNALLGLVCYTTIAQDVKPEGTTSTKMDIFSSKTGVIVKFVDTKLPNITPRLVGPAESRIRKVTSGSETRYFYQIVKDSKYATNTASIEFSDLLEVIKAVKTLKADLEKDLSSRDYLENRFTTVDGFQIGYYVSEGKASWFLKLGKYGSDNTLFIKDGDDVELYFSAAKTKIEELKK